MSKSNETQGQYIPEDNRRHDISIGDLWQHRADRMKCQTCMWFSPKGKLGRCRRHAPTMNGYPVVYPTDWCGDHKLDETK
jgi:hypothetical protein